MNKASVVQKRVNVFLLCLLTCSVNIFTDQHIVSFVGSVFQDLKKSFVHKGSKSNQDTFSKVTVIDSQGKSVPFPNLLEWIVACKSLPKNRENALWGENSGVDPAKYSGFEGTATQRWQQFKLVLDDFLQQKATGSLANSSDWECSNMGQSLPSKEFFDISLDEKKFMPFVQKLVAQQGDFFIVRGDLHGDIASLLSQLSSMREEGLIDDDFRLKKGCNMLFLGDYVDRGMYGAEVIYTIMRLMNANPNNVFAVRGNHEDLRINTGFQREVSAKFEDIHDQKRKQIGRMYKYLPVVLYLGDQSGRYFQCCHGGIEQGYDPNTLLNGKEKKYQLLGLLNRAQAVHDIIQKKGVLESVKSGMRSISPMMYDNVVLTSPAARLQLPLGFMWNDFDVENDLQARIQFGRGLIYGKDATGAVLHSKIMGIMRAHQHVMNPHNNLMQKLLRNKGICKLWKPDEQKSERELGDKGEVLMFNVAPDGGAYGARVGFDYDAAAIIEPREKGSWKMKVKNYHPFEA